MLDKILLYISPKRAKPLGFEATSILDGDSDE